MKINFTHAERHFILFSIPGITSNRYRNTILRCFHIGFSTRSRNRLELKSSLRQNFCHLLNNLINLFIGLASTHTVIDIRSLDNGKVSQREIISKQFSQLSNGAGRLVATRKSTIYSHQKHPDLLLAALLQVVLPEEQLVRERTELHSQHIVHLRNVIAVGYDIYSEVNMQLKERT